MISSVYAEEEVVTAVHRSRAEGETVPGFGWASADGL